MPRRSKPKEATPEQRSIQDPVAVELALTWHAAMRAAFYVSLILAKDRDEIRESALVSLLQIDDICPQAAYDALEELFPHIDKLKDLLNTPLFGPVLEIQRRKRHA